MEELGDLLGRIKHSLDKDAETREVVSVCIREVAGFDVRLEDISIKNRTVRIQTTPAKRNEIKLKEAKLLSLIRVRTNLDIENVTY